MIIRTQPIMPKPILLLLLAVITAAAAYHHHPPTVTIDSGPLFGLATTLPGAATKPVNKFLGIPYAAKPDRFRPSKRPQTWTEPRNATAFRPSCIQYISNGEVAPSPELVSDVFNNHQPESEDCLFINAFSPARTGGHRPVVVFIPGGAWQMSNGNFDLSAFSAYEDVVAFTFNYRTNIFGFPITDDIPLRQRNLGVMDQQLALAWVQANARAFGGDPEKVTIWGESAGAMAVDLHLHSYADSAKNRPPFRAAILSSGQMSFGLLAFTPPVNDTQGWRRLASVVGCRDSADQLECMRRVPAADLVANMERANFTPYPVSDGETVTYARAAAWRRGKVARVPLLMSTMAEEGRALLRRNVSIEAFRQAWMPETIISREKAGGIVAAYRRMPGVRNDFDVASAIYTDWVWQCPQQMLANASASLGTAPVWRAYIDASVTELLPPRYRYLGKFHGTDLILLFYVSALYGSGQGVSSQLYAAASYLRAVIGSFVRNPRAGPGWPAVGSSSAPRDVAVVGGRNSSKSAVMVDRNVLDANCGIFSDFLAASEKASDVY
ncbi:hypothetical protein L249_7714 [Ophiocordyceps polyrhachis-furcata BCC 54312]|uniref:Carboxylic ester hydrolase n=1 Tax=Ophiocordyceps polyrhachis-furcata BCC 54312 TaxID=1330021 RepID=A0A367LAR7_9HYPO|nr:hypothetical protein L249_7714 [Ophiocordyceps polyrhachis-furcata BCC 54312]